MIRPLEYCDNLSHVRSSIDCIDYRIIELIAQRAKYVQQAAQYKSSLEEVKADQRVINMFEQRSEWANSLHIEATLVENIFQTIIKHFFNLETEIFHEQS
ncbi:isochorismate pyruvate-lyase [Sphingobacterium sp. ML3W]|uniref:chorismate mutase n=1 Tax=Sphingobacterium sp. ML3W TaxID=1538644 RepID=UPI0004F8AD00|nr:chorismate mutase [Sphingobacterium sp. ML3W]AIM35609.1 isochorismate pyruvate-lyase [Sphingobacterium sp. ML3W]